MKLYLGVIMLLPIIMAAGQVKEIYTKDVIDKLQNNLEICRKNTTADSKNILKCNNDLQFCDEHKISEIARLENLIKECKVNETFLQSEIAKFGSNLMMCQNFASGLFYNLPGPSGSFYHFHNVNPKDVMLSQSDAEAFCISHGLKLVTIDDAVENAWLQDRISSIYTAAGQTGDATTYFRTNLKLQSDGTTWGWGSSGTAASFTDWKSGAVTYPDDASNNPCGNMLWQDNEVKWTNDDCTTPARFICEVDDPCA